MDAQERRALVVGATGGIGSATAAALERHGWNIRALSHRARPDERDAWEWVRGDALNREFHRSGGVSHSWAYLPDAGETFALLLRRLAELEPFARFHFRGHWDSDGTEMIAAIRRVMSRPDLKVRGMPWWLFRLLPPFQETMRELYAVRPLWRVPVELDNRKLVSFLGSEPHTPLDEAVHASLQSLGCLP